VDADEYNKWAGVGKPETLRAILTVAGKTKQMAYQADVVTAYLNAHTQERIFTKAGEEFGDLAGRVLIVNKALYGLATSANRWSVHLGNTLHTMGFTRSRGDDQTWYKFNTDGAVYDYIHTHVDDLTIVASEECAQRYIDELKKVYMLKDVGPLTHNLGIDYDRSESGFYVMSSTKYVTQAVQTVEEKLGKLRPYHSPIAADDHPELDESSKLEGNELTYYQSLVGMLQWIQAIGRMDISYAVSCMSQFSANPRQGHMDRLKRMFGYLKRHPVRDITLSPLSPTTLEDEDTTVEDDEFHLYPDAGELVDENHPDGNPLLEDLTLTCFVDADHAHDKVNRRSVTGAIIYLGSAPIKWMSRRQKSVSTSTYESEYYAMRIVTEEVVGMRYMLRSIGVPTCGPSSVYTDNKAVFQSSTVTKSKLKVKHAALSYHKTREAVAAKIITVHYIPTRENISDLMTKALPRHRHHDLCRMAC